MILCPLCENLFTRFEIAIEYFPFLAELYATALSEHAHTTHTPRRAIDASMFFSVPVEIYRTWLQQELSSKWLAAATPAAWVRDTPLAEIADGRRAELRARGEAG